jgi:beta-lactamase class A
MNYLDKTGIAAADITRLSSFNTGPVTPLATELSTTGLQPAALEKNITDISGEHAGRVGVSARSLDGRHEINLEADGVYPTASSIKIFVLYTLLVEADRQRISLAERVELTDDVLMPGSGVLFHLDAGLRPTLRDLATLMMMISDNSAMIFLSQFLGLDTINRQIDRLGLSQTWLGDWRRFDTEYADSMKFGTGTPREFTEFLLRMQRGELLEADSTELFWDLLRIQKYILPLRRHLPVSPWSREFGFAEPVWVASKGGTLDDCASESGLVRVHDGGWVISVMIGEIPEIAHRPEIGENLISNISLAIYDSWAPLYSTGDINDR